MSNNNRNSNTNGNNNRNSVVILGKRYNINTTTHLDLSDLSVERGIHLSYLPETIGRLTNLEVFHLCCNRLKRLPESIGRLTKLEYLNLDVNNLTSLPESIGNLTNLKELDLERNNLRSLPESIGRLTKLEYLDLTGNELTSLPKSFKNLNSDIEIYYSGSIHNRNQFIKSLKPKKVSMNTELFNNAISKTNKLPPKNKRVYINTNSNVKNNGELRRLYNKNGINQYMNGRTTGHLHGGNFTKNNVKKLTNKNVVNKNVYLRNIKSRLRNSSLNNFKQTVERIKSNLPSNINRNDVNNIVRSMKPQILQKIFNKLKNSPSNNRVRIMNTMKNRGFMNQNDITVMKRRLNNVRNSPYI